MSSSPERAPHGSVFGMELEHVSLDSDTPGQEFFLRVMRFRGSGGGPTVYMQAALHAHELPGMVALDQLIPRLQSAENEGRLAGNVTLVPHANPIGLSQAVFGETLGRFDLHGRINFNRSFPSELSEELTGQTAPQRLKALLIELAVEADVVLDLHCDDEGPVYLYISERQLDEGQRLARAMQAAVILTDSGKEIISFDLAVSARWAAQNRPNDARFAATIELRGMMDVTSATADRDADGLYRYLADIGTVIDDLPAIDLEDFVSGDVDAAQLIATPVPGAILYHVSVGEWVSKGQRLALILSNAGMTPHEVLCPFDGLVMTRRDRRFARRGEDVIKVLRHPTP